MGKGHRNRTPGNTCSNSSLLIETTASSKVIVERPGLLRQSVQAVDEESRFKGSMRLPAIGDASASVLRSPVDDFN